MRAAGSAYLWKSDVESCKCIQNRVSDAERQHQVQRISESSITSSLERDLMICGKWSTRNWGFSQAFW
jgi:hypothetical protein